MKNYFLGDGTNAFCLSSLGYHIFDQNLIPFKKKNQNLKFWHRQLPQNVELPTSTKLEGMANIWPHTNLIEFTYLGCRELNNLNTSF